MKRSGVYLFLRAGAPVYVGRSVNMRCRVARHRREHRDFGHDEIQFRYMPMLQAWREERRLLNQHRPQFNFQGNRGHVLPLNRSCRSNDFPKLSFRPSSSLLARVKAFKESSGLSSGRIIKECIDIALPVLESKHQTAIHLRD